MAQQIINIGSAADDDTGDLNRACWQKANANFTELYGVDATKVAKTGDTMTGILTVAETSGENIILAGSNFPAIHWTPAAGATKTSFLYQQADVFRIGSNTADIISVNLATAGTTFAGDTTSANYPSGAWTAWTPTISASSGTITSTTINTARYTKAGKTTMVFLDVTITNHGTGAGTFNFTLPVACASAGGGTFNGREIALSGNGLNSIVLPSATVATVAVYNGSTPIGTGSRIVMSGLYEGA